MKCLNLRHLGFLIDICIKSIETRFSIYFENNPQSEMAIIATTLLPKFRLRWLNSFKNTNFILQENQVKNMVLKAAKEFVSFENYATREVIDEEENEDFFELSTVSEIYTEKEAPSVSHEFE
ncbi:unnamed protein product [Psylliodes chrysocephalus]|uniref:Uncharacterized protein n=1 Tax=Psylliodes chrysocephalus TaxID=3402493 RepID=A0A9P0G9D6_9CUCU|nr:unnamed protein product [Psylliodes chrysocephala]